MGPYTKNITKLEDLRLPQVLDRSQKICRARAGEQWDHRDISRKDGSEKGSRGR